MAVMHTYKTKTGTEARRPSPVRAFWNKYLDISCWVDSEVKARLVTDCAVYPYRMGRNPKAKKEHEQAP